MACSCRNKKNSTYLWTSSTDSTDQVVYSSEIQAKAAVIRKGGSYVKQGG